MTAIDLKELLEVPARVQRVLGLGLGLASPGGLGLGLESSPEMIKSQVLF